MNTSIKLLLLVLILVTVAQNANAKCGAGTILYFNYRHETFLLLADHSRVFQRGRGWSGFGGRCDGDSPAVAAARETEEETRGIFSRREIVAKISSDLKIRVGDFTTYFVEVDFVPAIVINNQDESGRPARYRERSPFAWIPVSVIWQAITKRQNGRAIIPDKYLPSDARTNWLFEPFAGSLEAAKSAGILPWDQ